MLKRSVFESVVRDRRGARELRACRGMTHRGRSGPGVPRQRSGGSPTRSAAPNADDVDREARFPTEAMDALERRGALSALIPTSSAAAGHRLRGRRRGVLRARPALRRERDGLRDAPDPGRDDRPPRRRTRRGSRTISRDVARGAAARRVGHLRDRHRRRPRPVDRRRHARPTTVVPVREAGTDRLVRRLRGRPADHAAPRRPMPSPATRWLSLTSRDAARARADRAPGIPWACAGRARPGYIVRARVPDRSRSCPTPFSTGSPTESMVPISHILWSHLWLGIATDAFDRARAFVRGVGEGQARTSRRRPRSACRS